MILVPVIHKSGLSMWVNVDAIDTITDTNPTTTIRLRSLETLIVRQSVAELFAAMTERVEI